MATDPADYIAQLEAYLANEDTIGLTSIRHPDGRALTMSRDLALKELEYWEQRQTDGRWGMRSARMSLKGDA